jgi:hypothetical protein
MATSSVRVGYANVYGVGSQLAQATFAAAGAATVRPFPFNASDVINVVGRGLVRGVGAYTQGEPILANGTGSLVGTGSFFGGGGGSGTYAPLFQPPAGVWSGAGLQSGIPVGRTTYTTLAVGATAAQINAALSACPSGQDVLLSAGAYPGLSSTLVIPAGRALKGAGMNATVLTFNSGVYGMHCGNSNNWQWPGTSSTVTSDVSQGQTQLTLVSAAAFTVGTICRVHVPNMQNNAAITAGAVPVIGTTSSGGASRSMKHKIIAKNGNTITIAPGLLWDMTGLGTVTVISSLGQTNGIGVESLTISANATYGMYWESCVDSWVYNVRVNQAANYAFFHENCVSCTFKKMYIFGTSAGPNHSDMGFAWSDGSCWCLTEDCIMDTGFPLIETNGASSGNVFAYNFGYNSNSGGQVGGAFDDNHNAHNCFNLYEGNIGPTFQTDGYFGSCSEGTVFRNYLHGTSPGATDRGAMILKRFTRRYQILGNVFGGAVNPYSEVGTPNIGNGSSSGSVQPTKGTFWASWPGTGGLGTGGGYQEMDLDVAASCTFKNNYYNGTIIAGESLGTQALPQSLYLSGKPAWFNSMAWPPVDSTAPLLPITNISIPAKYRFLNGGADPP